MAPHTRARAAQAASASANQVFDTYELLEEILLHLSIRDLFLSQRVAKQWQSLIKQSLKLQQALFLQAGPPLVCWQKQHERHLVKVNDASKTYAAMQPDAAPVEFQPNPLSPSADPWSCDGSNDQIHYYQVSYQDAGGDWYQGQRSRSSGLLRNDIKVGAVPNV